MHRPPFRLNSLPTKQAHSQHTLAVRRTGAGGPLQPFSQVVSRQISARRNNRGVSDARAQAGMWCSETSVLGNMWGLWHHGVMEGLMQTNVSAGRMIPQFLKLPATKIVVIGGVVVAIIASKASIAHFAGGCTACRYLSITCEGDHVGPLLACVYSRKGITSEPMPTHTFVNSYLH